MTELWQLLHRLIRRDEGQSLLEYVIVIILVALVVIVVLTLLRDQINAALQFVFG